MLPQALGLAVLMAKAGLPVPATPPVRLPPFSAVLADIGDEQSLSASLSTFSGHLRRIQARGAGPRQGSIRLRRMCATSAVAAVS
jgi:hypothetical protein